MRAQVAGGKTLSSYFLDKLRGNHNWQNALFVKTIVEELINFGNYDTMNKYAARAAAAAPAFAPARAGGADACPAHHPARSYIDIITAVNSLTELMMIHIKYIYNYYEKIMPGLFSMVLEHLWHGPENGVLARTLLEDVVDVLLVPSCKLTREDIESRVRVLVRTTTVIEYTSGGTYAIVDFAREAVEIFLTEVPSRSNHAK